MNIKRTISIALLSCLAIVVKAQSNTEGVSIAPNVVPPHPSAMLDVSSINKGILIPRVDIIDLSTDVPVSGAEVSLLVYNTNITSGVGYYFWNGTVWSPLGGGGSLWSRIGTTNDIRYAQGKVQMGVGVSSAPVSELEVINPGASNLFNFEGSTGYGLNFGLFDAAGAGGAGSFLTQFGGTLSNGIGSVAYTHVFADGKIGLNFRSFHNLGNPFTTINSPDATGGFFITSAAGITLRPFNSAVSVFLDNSGMWQTSDSTLKTNVTSLTPVLSSVMNCRPVQYNWLDNPTGDKMCGFIAQEIEAIFPDMVSESVDPETGIATKGVNYTGLSAILFGAVQEQQTIIEQQQATISAMELRLQALEGQ